MWTETINNIKKLNSKNTLTLGKYKSLRIAKLMKVRTFKIGLGSQKKQDNPRGKDDGYLRLVNSKLQGKLLLTKS